jgi:hypothetical protein
MAVRDARLVPLVLSLNPADGAALAPHHHAVGARASLEVADALQEVAIGDAGRGKEDIVALAEVISRQDLRDRGACGKRRLLLVSPW